MSLWWSLWNVKVFLAVSIFFKENMLFPKRALSWMWEFQPLVSFQTLCVKLSWAVCFAHVGFGSPALCWKTCKTLAVKWCNGYLSIRSKEEKKCTSVFPLNILHLPNPFNYTVASVLHDRFRKYRHGQPREVGHCPKPTTVCTWVCVCVCVYKMIPFVLCSKTGKTNL